MQSFAPLTAIDSKATAASANPGVQAAAESDETRPAFALGSGSGLGAQASDKPAPETRESDADAAADAAQPPAADAAQLTPSASTQEEWLQLMLAQQQVQVRATDTAANSALPASAQLGGETSVAATELLDTAAANTRASTVDSALVQSPDAQGAVVQSNVAQSDAVLGDLAQGAAVQSAVVQDAGAQGAEVQIPAAQFAAASNSQQPMAAAKGAGLNPASAVQTPATGAVATAAVASANSAAAAAESGQREASDAVKSDGVQAAGNQNSLTQSSLLASALSHNAQANSAQQSNNFSQLNPAADASQNSQLSSFKFDGPEAKWGEQMLHALRDNVQLQLQQKIQQATIRLDPPELGSLDIYLRHEAGRISVHINASQADTARLLQGAGERLRQDLQGAQFAQVEVSYGQASGQQSGQQRARQEQPWASLAENNPRAANELATSDTGPRSRERLVTV